MNRVEKTFLLLLVFIPLSFYFAIFLRNSTLAFISATIALIPLATIIGYSTKELALQTNPSISGLISATFGNSIELIIAVFALSRGLTRLVQASIVGSIIGNILLLTGLSIFFGGLKYKEQRFNKTSLGVSSTMLIIAVVGLAIPSVYNIAADPNPRQVQTLSDAVAIVLALIYIAGLVFSLFTHKDLFDASDTIRASKEKPTINKRKAGLILLFATIFVALVSEVLVREVKPATEMMGLTQTFVGVVIIAIITNIAEKSSSINFALQNKLDISLEVGLSSAIQIALFVVPILVLISDVFNYNFSLVFTLFEIIAVIFAVMIVNHLSSDGRCNWLEGAQLMSVYLIIAIAFYFI